MHTHKHAQLLFSQLRVTARQSDHKSELLSVVVPASNSDTLHAQPVTRSVGCSSTQASQSHSNHRYHRTTMFCI